MSETTNTTSEKTLSAGRIIQKIGTSTDYIRARNIVEHKGVSVERRRPVAIQMAAVALRGKRPGEYMTLEEHSLNITSHLATLEDTMQTLRDMEEYGAKRKERLPYLKKIAEFNHDLKDMVDTNSNLRFNDVVTFIRTMNQQIHGRHDDSAFNTGLRETLEGMRHELAAEQIIGCIDSVQYRHATTEEDLHGGDFLVSANGSPFVPIDIKASYLTAERKREHARQNGFDDSHIIWPEVDGEDFNGGFHISSEAAAKKAPAMERAILHTIARQTRLKRSA